MCARGMTHRANTQRGHWGVSCKRKGMYSLPDIAQRQHLECSLGLWGVMIWQNRRAPANFQKPLWSKVLERGDGGLHGSRASSSLACLLLQIFFGSFFNDAQPRKTCGRDRWREIKMSRPAPVRWLSTIRHESTFWQHGQRSFYSS